MNYLNKTLEKETLQQIKEEHGFFAFLGKWISFKFKPLKLSNKFYINQLGEKPKTIGQILEKEFEIIKENGHFFDTEEKAKREPCNKSVEEILKEDREMTRGKHIC